MQHICFVNIHQSIVNQTKKEWCDSKQNFRTYGNFSIATSLCIFHQIRLSDAAIFLSTENVGHVLIFYLDTFLLNIFLHIILHCTQK